MAVMSLDQRSTGESEEDVFEAGSSHQAGRRRMAVVHELGQRAFAVVGTKIDAQGNGQRRRDIERFCRDRQMIFFPISSATREGLDTLRAFLAQRLQEIEAA